MGELDDMFDQVEVKAIHQKIAWFKKEERSVLREKRRTKTNKTQRKKLI